MMAMTAGNSLDVLNFPTVERSHELYDLESRADLERQEDKRQEKLRRFVTMAETLQALP